MARAAKTTHFQLPRPAKKPEAQPDPIFFTKGQIEVGVVVLFVGRLDPNSLWMVEQIRPAKAGKKLSDQTSVLKLADRVYLRRVGYDDVRVCSFSYLSYSAIWRLRE